MEKADIGMIGLGVMGRMLALNMERNGYRIAGFDLDPEKVQALTANRPDKNLVGFDSLEDFIEALEKPRRLMMMVPAGKPVDAVIGDLKPILDPGDLLIDGGNTHFTDTERRAGELEAAGVIYIGAGISGGEYGALWGPSIMPGGPQQAWELIQPIFETISAKVNGEPSVTHIGPKGSGHYVKMVHNGIEYADMQLIAETYDLLHRGLGLSTQELHEIFSEWNEGELESYLVEITRDIFGKVDEDSGQPLVDLILDEAKQKGTGKWTSQDALDLGVATPTINAAVEARIISAYREERIRASRVLDGPEPKFEGDLKLAVDTVRDALLAAKICAFAQGFALMRTASEEYAYSLNFSEIARIWRGGCIIRARLLEDIRTAYQRTPGLINLLMDPDLGKSVESRQDALRDVVKFAADNGIPAPAFSSALAYFDAYRTARLPANLTQAQRDYFGAHTYQRLDKEGTFHTDWVDISKEPEE
ncbi:MAG: NADP-dependent phosphogluconate dehydrogenase [Anaerolineales bacterium]|nr:NADP-dependent phosphogluconate dehydrogenase [Anaerolineales bacterium]